MLFLINSLAGGGAERVFAGMLEHGRDILPGYDAHVALLDDDPPAYELPAGLQVRQLDCRHSFARSLRSVARTAADLRPDLIVSFLTRANVAAVLGGAVAPCPVIISERNDTSAQLAHLRVPLIARLVVRLSYSRAQRVITVSDGIGDQLHANYGVPRERIETINNPVDIAAVTRAAAMEPELAVAPDDVVMLARLEAQKNLDVAIRAFHASGSPGRLLILGEGSLRPQLRALGDQLGIDDRLVMPGYIRNPYAVLARARLLMLSSRHEGFCNSLLEAMALGVPILASDCRFSPAEILQVHASPRQGGVVIGNGGLLVAVDDEAALADGLRMLDDPLVASELGRHGRRRAQDFSIDKLLGSYWAAFDEVLRQPSGRSRLTQAKPAALPAT